jgi:hypothetical protein
MAANACALGDPAGGKDRMTYHEERVVRVRDMIYTIRRWVVAARAKGTGKADNKRNREERGDAQP